MHRTTQLNHCLAAAFASCLAFAPTSVSALTLGNLVVHSRLGQPLRAQVLATTGPDEIVDSSCISLARASTTAEHLPYITQAKLSVENTARGQFIHIRSIQSINEPILKMLLQITCGGQTSLSREFTVLLDPQDYGSAMPLPQEDLPVAKRADIPDAPIPGADWEIRAGDRLDTIARSLYPASRSKKRRMEQAIVEANPLIFKDGDKADLPVGQMLKIPELFMAQRATPSTAQVKPKRNAKKAATADTFQLKLSTGEIDLSTSRNLTEEDRLRLREKQLLLEADDQVANILALKNRVKQLETQLNELSLKMSNRVSEASTPAAAQSTQNAPTSTMQLFWYGLAGLSALLGTFFVMRRHKQKQETEETLHSFQLSMPDTESADRLPIPAATTARSLEAAASQTPKTHNEEVDYDPHSIFVMPEEQISLTEMDSVIEEADLYLIYGWTQKATDLLQNYIEKHPLELQPWMMLFDIYHSQGMKDAFDKLAPRFKEKFDNPEAWKKVQALGHALSPKNPMYVSEEQQAAQNLESTDETVNSEKPTEVAPEIDYWSQAKVDFRPNSLQQSVSNQPLADNTDTPLPRIKDI